MEYGSPAGLIASLIALDRELAKASPERRDALLAARTMWEQQITHWDTPLIDPMLAGTVLGLMVGRALMENLEEGETREGVEQAIIWHLYCVWLIRSDLTVNEHLPPDPFGEARPHSPLRRAAVRLTGRLLIRLLRQPG